MNDVAEVLSISFLGMILNVAFLAIFLTFILKSKIKDKQEILKAPLWYVCLAGPILEEVLFRLIPSLIYGYSWSIGIAVSVVFGLLHSSKLKGKKFIIDFDDIHYIPTILAGLLLWYINAEYGFGYAVLAHVFNNSVTIGIVLGLKKMLKKKRRK